MKKRIHLKIQMKRKMNKIIIAAAWVICMQDSFAQNIVSPVQSELNTETAIDTVIRVVDAAKAIKHFTVSENGIVQQDGYFTGDKKSGKWFNYYPNGVLLSVSEYENGMKNGIYIECEKSGAVVVQEYFKNDVLEGEQKKYSTSKNVRIVKSIYNFKNGVYDGLCTDFNDMGIRQAEILYAEGKKQGAAKWYFSNGSLAMEQMYASDLLQGPQKVYNLQGVVITEGVYSNNTKSGQWTEYYDNGGIKAQGNYTADVKSGTWKYYDEKGKVIKTENF